MSFDIRVVFPLSSLSSPTLLIQENLNSIYEYYLMENLAINLVKDVVNPNQPEIQLTRKIEYRENSVVLYLHDHMKWSNGKKISLDDVASSLKLSIANGGRHLSLLTKYNKLNLLHDVFGLEFVFTTDISKSAFLHELSLADTAIISPLNRKGDWTVTSGPYSIDTYIYGEKLTLNKNLFYDSANSGYPDKVVLFSIPNSNEKYKAFSLHKADLVYFSGFSFAENYQTLKTDFPFMTKSYPTSIMYLKLTLSSDIYQNQKLRESLATLIQSELKQNDMPFKDFTVEKQFAPRGYSGRISPVAKSFKNISLPRSVKLKLWGFFKEYKSFENILSRAFIKNDISTTFFYDECVDCDYSLGAIKGNQSDISGTLSFLLEEFRKTPYYQLFHKELSSINHEVVEEKRLERMKSLHRKMIDTGLLVPLVAYPTTAFHSDRIDLSDWNPFDFRLRFYEIRKK